MKVRTAFESNIVAQLMVSAVLNEYEENICNSFPNILFVVNFTNIVKSVIVNFNNLLEL